MSPHFFKNEKLRKKGGMYHNIRVSSFLESEIGDKNVMPYTPTDIPSSLLVYNQ